MVQVFIKRGESISAKTIFFRCPSAFPVRAYYCAETFLYSFSFFHIYRLSKKPICKLAKTPFPEWRLFVWQTTLSWLNSKLCTPAIAQSINIAFQKKIDSFWRALFCGQFRSFLGVYIIRQLFPTVVCSNVMFIAFCILATFNGNSIRSAYIYNYFIMVFSVFLL